MNAVDDVVAVIVCSPCAITLGDVYHECRLRFGRTYREVDAALPEVLDGNHGIVECPLDEQGYRRLRTSE